MRRILIILKLVIIILFVNPCLPLRGSSMRYSNRRLLLRLLVAVLPLDSSSSLFLLSLRYGSLRYDAPSIVFSDRGRPNIPPALIGIVLLHLAPVAHLGATPHLLVLLLYSDPAL